MLQITKFDRQNLLKSLHKDIIDSYNHYHIFNDKTEECPRNDIETLWNLLDSQELYIVLRQNRFIGFFTHQIHDGNKEISFEIYMSPFACPKSNLSLTKCAVTNCIIKYLENREIEHLEFITGHPLVVTAVQAIIPDVQINMINPRTIICYKALKDTDVEPFETFLIEAVSREQDNNYDNYTLLR